MSRASRRLDGDQRRVDRRSSWRRSRSPARKRPQAREHARSSTPARKSLNADRTFTPDEREESDLFMIDRNGDCKNIEYGSLHRYTIPQYRRAGFGFLVGRPSIKIDQEASTDTETVLVDFNRTSERQPRPLTSHQGKLNGPGVRLVAATGAGSGEDSTDFILLDPSRKRKRTDCSPGPQITSVDYRSIEGEAKASSQPEQDRSGTDAEEADPHEDENLIFRQQNAVLSKQAKSNPTDLDSWLALAEHQAKLVRPSGLVGIASFTASERRALADLRLSVLNEATAHIIPGKVGREQLLVAVIDEGQYLWDSAKLASKWHDALKESPSSIVLWAKYLDHLQDSHNSFRYEDCRDSFARCLRLLYDTRAAGNGESHAEVANTAVFLMLRFTAFMRDAGYDEVAFATWQAVLEYHFSMPDYLSESSPEEKLAAFEDFWDGEAPRIGEEGGSGWSGHVGSQAAAFRASPPDLRDMRTSATSMRDLANKEARLLGRLLLPATTDEDAVADPYRHVLFSDICELLRCLQMEIPRAALIDTFLLFLGLPAVLWRRQAASWPLDPHLCGNQISLIASPEGASKVRARLEPLFDLFEGGFEQFPRHAQDVDGRGDTLAQFVDRVLESLAWKLRQDQALAESIGIYHVAFRSHIFPSEVRKLAKRLLKDRPSSLRLYNAYALAEVKTGHIDKAYVVWDTAISTKDRLSSIDDMVFLWHSRLMTKVVLDDHFKALRDLLAISGESTSTESRVQHLKAKRELESGFDRAILSGRPEHAALYIDLQAWLTYLTSGSVISEPLVVYQQYDVLLSKQGYATTTLELFHQYKANLITKHLDCQRQYKPLLLRQDVEASLARFPNNSTLLELQQRLLSQDRLRIMFEQQKLDRPLATVVQWSHRLSEEIQRNETYGTTAHAVRASFHKALLGVDSAVRHSPALWTMWLRWELARPGREGNAKQVFLDGLRRLPWYKSWIVLGMKDIQGSERELQQWHDVLIERGLRARVELE